MSTPHLNRSLRFAGRRVNLQSSRHGRPYPQQRGFHPSRPNLIIAEALQLSHYVFEGVHSMSGLPWALSIPLTAVAFRLPWIPIQMLIARNQERRSAIAQPLYAWRKIFQARAVAVQRSASESDARQAEAWVKARLSEREAVMRKDLPTLKPWVEFALPLMFLPVWFLNAETIRRMSGDSRGLLAWIPDLNHGKGAVTAGSAADTATTSSTLFEPGLQTEFLPWTADLVSSDPYLVLPAIFLFCSVANAHAAVGRDPNADIRASMGGTRIGRAKLEFATAIRTLAWVFPLSLIWQQMPSAVVLYLIGSSASMLLQRMLVKMLRGSQKPIRPLNAKAPMGIDEGLPK